MFYCFIIFNYNKNQKNFTTSLQYNIQWQFPQIWQLFNILDEKIIIKYVTCLKHIVIKNQSHKLTFTTAEPRTSAYKFDQKYTLK